MLWAIRMGCGGAIIAVAFGGILGAHDAPWTIARAAGGFIAAFLWALKMRSQQSSTGDSISSKSES